MRRVVPALAALALAGCASDNVTLLEAEPGMPVGAVAVFNPKTEAERGQLTEANTQASGGTGKVRPRKVDGAQYAWIGNTLPAQPAHYILYFKEGATDLMPGSEGELAKLLADVARRPGAEVQVTGHTDTVGQQADNDALSLARAKQIRDSLVRQGVDLAISRATGRGERELLVPTPDNTAEEKNRRVEVTVR